MKKPAPIRFNNALPTNNSTDNVVEVNKNADAPSEKASSQCLYASLAHSTNKSSHIIP